MARLFNSLLLIAGLVVTGGGLVVLQNDFFKWLIVAGGVGMLCVALYLDRLRVCHQDETVAKEIADRTVALTGRPWQLHERLETPPNRWLFGFVLGMTLVGGLLLQLGFSTPGIEWPLVLGGAFFLAIGVLMLPTLLPGVGKPALVLDRKGLTTPVDGAISWSDVEGIYLQVVEHRGTKNYSLVFRVPAYAKVVSSIHWSQHWLALFGLGALRRGQVGVPLRPGKERPETIEAVARYLWKSATGREYFWNPHVSPASNEAFRQLAMLRSSMEAPTNLERDFLERPDQAVAQMEATVERLEQGRHHIKVIENEQKRAKRKLYWGMLIIFAVMLAALIFPWVKRITAS